MALPNVHIAFANGALGTVEPSADSVVGLIAPATAVSGTFELAKAYTIYKSTALTSLGITEENNAALYKAVTDFYTQAGEGAELWIYGSAKTSSVDLIDEASTFVKAANGRLRILAVASDDIADADGIALAGAAAQLLGENATTQLYAPIFTILPVASSADISALPDLGTYSNDRVGFLIGDTVADSDTSCIGLLAGRIAECDVQVHIGRVKDGALSVSKLYIGGDDPSVADVESLHNKGYITFRTFVGKSGYYFNDDSLACDTANDYKSIARRRTVDKAYREAYDILCEHINEELEVTADGTLVAAIARSWENEIVAGIYNTMTSEGNLSVDDSDSSDKGVRVSVDTTNNVLSTNQVNVEIQVRPYGYAKYISVELGFQTNE